LWWKSKVGASNGGGYMCLPCPALLRKALANFIDICPISMHHQLNQSAEKEAEEEKPFSMKKLLSS
jgi:hypothetical protein